MNGYPLYGYLFLSLSVFLYQRMYGFSYEPASTSSYECLCLFSECTLGFPLPSQMISNRMTMLPFAGKACVSGKQKRYAGCISLIIFMNPERPQCRSKGLGSGFHLQIVKLVEKLRIIDSGHDEWLFFWNQQRKYFFQLLTLGYLQVSPVPCRLPPSTDASIRQIPDRLLLPHESPAFSYGKSDSRKPPPAGSDIPPSASV